MKQRLGGAVAALISRWIAPEAPLLHLDIPPSGPRENSRSRAGAGGEYAGTITDPGWNTRLYNLRAE